MKFTSLLYLLLASFTFNAFAANNPEDEKAAVAATLGKIDTPMNSYSTWMADINAEASRLGFHFNNGIEVAAWRIGQEVKEHPEIISKASDVNKSSGAGTDPSPTIETGSTPEKNAQTDKSTQKENNSNTTTTNDETQNSKNDTGNNEDKTEQNLNRSDESIAKSDDKNHNEGNTNSVGQQGVDSGATEKVITSTDLPNRNHSQHNASLKMMNMTRSYTDRRFNQAERQIENNSRAIKRLGATAEAAANLHYNSNHSGYAIAVGEYNGESALATGIQFQTGKTTALTLQASYDDESAGGSVGFHGDF
ncbi:YadA-like family protein [Enterobacter cancerogenus]